jgi:hypothetical protein
MKYIQLFEDRMSNMSRLAKLGLMDEDTLKVYRYLEVINDPDDSPDLYTLKLEDYSHESLPPELTHVKGDLNLMGAKIKSLPDGFKVDGTLFLNSSDIESLPNGLIVVGSLILESTPISSIPEDLKVKGSLILANTPNLTQLPQKMDVGAMATQRIGGIQFSELSLGDSSIETLPEGFHVTGSLDLSGSDIEELPNGLRVGGDLYLRYSNVDLDRLPARMSIGGDLQITRHQWMSIGQRTRDRLAEMVNGEIDIS